MYGRVFSRSWWKGIFLLVETHFLSIFQTFLPVIYADTRHLCQFFSRRVETYFWKESFILASGNGFSGQWKTFCSNNSSAPSIGSGSSISWKYILNESFITVTGNKFSVLWRRYSFYSFIHIFLETIIANRGRPVFTIITKKKTVKRKPKAKGNRFLHFIFSDTYSNGSSFSVQRNCIFQGIIYSG